MEAGVEVVLVNAQHVKGLPGRKTDVQDCEWIAELHLYGLVKPSFIPPPDKRHHRLLLKTHLMLIDGFDAAMAGLTEQIEECLRPFASILERLDEVTGVGRDVATVFVSEMGVDMKRWATPGHAASWAGLCPGHHESAGRRQSGRTRHPGAPGLAQGGVHAGGLGVVTRQGDVHAGALPPSRRAGTRAAGARRPPWRRATASLCAASF